MLARRRKIGDLALNEPLHDVLAGHRANVGRDDAGGKQGDLENEAGCPPR